MLSAFSVTDDLASCTRCSGVRTVSFDAFRSRVADRPYRELLRFHLRRHDRERLQRGLQGSLAVLPAGLRRLGRQLSNRWADRLRAGELDGVGCGEMIDRMERLVAKADAGGAGSGGRPGDDLLFDLFEAATLDLALEALDDPALRESVGRDRGGPIYRLRWNLVAGGLLAWGLTVTDDPVWVAALWVGLGLALLPPVARLVAGRVDGD